MSNRLDKIKQYVNETIAERCAPEKQQDHLVHLYGVSSACVIFALKRGLDPELCAISGLLHDVYAYVVDSYTHHAHSGAEMARVVLKRINLFSAEEQAQICSAIFHHDDIETVNAPYDEVLKDADILHPFLLHGGCYTWEHRLPRILSIAEELGLSVTPKLYPPSPAHENIPDTPCAERRAAMAQTLAAQKIRGEHEDQAYMELIKYWPEKESFDELKNGWCAAFVYHICMLCGTPLPIKHPKCSYRFAGVGAWYHWAADSGFYYPDTPDFTPQRGDIVIYDHIIPENKKPADSLWHDHTGVVVYVDGGYLDIAEGNAGNDNVSGIFRRNRGENIGGYIRIPEDYIYR